MEETSQNNTGKSRNIAAGAVILAILATGVGAYWYMNSQSGGADVAPNDSGAAIVVDGTQIDQATLDRSIEQITNTYATQGVDTSGEEAASAIKDQAITALINRQLMINAATEAGYTASAEEVDVQYQAALTNVGGEENLAAALAGINMTNEDLRADISKDVMISKYLEETLNLSAITVSDEEVTAAYNTAAASSTEEVPPMVDVAELIRSQLLLEKQQQLISTELERLRAEAEIEVLA